jgi:multiple sugar transport system substrate-binding protein
MAPRAGLLCVLVLVACGRAATDAAVIELWAFGREGEMVARLLPEFERRHPGLRVRVQQIPWSAAHEKLLTAYVGGAMPDLFQLGSTWIPELVAIGALEPLDGLIAGSSVVARDDYFPGILDANVIDGTTWGVPWYVDTRLLFYRSDVLARAGHPTPPRTWAEWIEAMTRVKEQAGPDRHAILLPVTEWEAPVILALQLGAGLLRDGDRYGDFQNPAFREAFGFYLDLFRRGLASRAGAADVANLYQDFASGAFSFCLTGPWNLGEFRRRLPASLAESWSTAPMPGPDAERPGISLAGGASLVLVRTSQRKEAAFRLVEFLSEPERQVEFYQLSGDLPARRSAWAAPALAGDPRAGAFFAQLRHVRPTPKVPEWERIAAAISRHAEAAIRGHASPEQALKALDGEVDAVLEKRRWLLRAARPREASPR